MTDFGHGVWHQHGTGMAAAWHQTRLVPASSGSFLGRKWPSATSSRQMQVQIANADAARVPPSATRYFVSFVSFVRQDGAKRIDKFGK